jgi:putative effector of murein hydrolase LrgA (UPF0299 family)
VALQGQPFDTENISHTFHVILGTLTFLFLPFTPSILFLVFVVVTFSRVLVIGLRFHSKKHCLFLCGAVTNHIANKQQHEMEGDERPMRQQPVEDATLHDLTRSMKHLATHGNAFHLCV